MFDGRKRVGEMKGFLVSCSPETEFYGFRPVKTIRSIEILGKRYDDGSRAWNCLYFTKMALSGKFKTLSIEPEGSNDMKINCLWISGKNSGKRFSITTGNTYSYTQSELHPDLVFAQTHVPVVILFIGTLLAVIFKIIENYELIAKLVNFLKSI